MPSKATKKPAKRKRGGREPASQVNAVLVSALATGATQQEAAELANVSRDTVINRMAEPGFRAELEQAQNEIIDQTIGRAVSNLTAAMDKLVELMGSTDESVALRAAQAVLDQTVRLRDAQVNARRLAEMEQQLKQLQEGGRATSAV